MLAIGKKICLVILLMLSGCDADNPKVFSGYSHGEFIYLSYAENSRIVNIFVEKGALVKPKQKLVKMETFSAENVLQRAERNLQAESAMLENLQSGDRPEELNVVRAQLERAQTAEQQAKRQLERYRKLYAAHTVSTAEWENARDDFTQKHAEVEEFLHQLRARKLPARQAEISHQMSRVEAAMLDRDKAKWDVEQSVLYSPVEARVYDIIYRVGERPLAGKPILSLLPYNNIKIRFYVPEKVLGSLQVGAKVKLSCDGCKNIIPGVINYISPEAEYTPPLIYSTKRREKLIFMAEAIPVRERIADIKIGQPYDVEIIHD